jgi:hypothetical protein
LSDNDKKLKKSLETELKVFYVFVEQLELNKNVVQMESHNNFQEIRHKLDLHREELKEKIDKIYFEMIDKTKEQEKVFASRIESLNYRGEIQTLDKEIHSVNESFRHLNVSLDSIKRMVDERKSATIEIVAKLSQLNQIKKYLIKSNEFEPNLGFYKKDFGRLNLFMFEDELNNEQEDEEDDTEDEDDDIDDDDDDDTADDDIDDDDGDDVEMMH